jgi:hypothetical protein
LRIELAIFEAWLCRYLAGKCEEITHAQATVGSIKALARRFLIALHAWNNDL